MNRPWAAIAATPAPVSTTHASPNASAEDRAMSGPAKVATAAAAPLDGGECGTVAPGRPVRSDAGHDGGDDSDQRRLAGRPHDRGEKRILRDRGRRHPGAL